MYKKKMYLKSPIFLSFSEALFKLFNYLRFSSENERNICDLKYIICFFPPYILNNTLKVGICLNI